MDLGNAILLVLAVCLGVGLLVYTKFIQPRNAALSEKLLAEEGFEYIFVDDYYDFFAFDGVEQIRLGSLLSPEFYGCSAEAIRDSRWEWTDDGRTRYDRFILHIGDPNRPMHVLKYKNKKGRVEREWARLDVVLSHARYVFEQSANQGLEEDPLRQDSWSLPSGRLP